MLINPPTWTQNGSYTAEQDRQLIGAIVRTEGVANSSSMVPTVVANTRQVSISSGGAYIRGDYAQEGAGGGGMYFSHNNGAYEVALPVAGTLPRYDLIVLRIYDSAVSGSVNEARYEVISGTPANSPRIPSVPGSSIPIAAVKANPGTTQIQLSDLSDQRTIAQFNGTITGSVTPAQEARLNQTASPTNPVVITRIGAPGDLFVSTGSGFETIGGVNALTQWSELPKTASEGTITTVKSNGRTYQFRDGAWKHFAGWGPYVSLGRTADVSHTGQYIGGMILNAGAPTSWGSETPKSSSDYSSYFTVVSGTSGTTLSRAGGVTFKKPGKYHVEARYQIIGRTAGTKVRSRIAGPDISQFTAIDNSENHTVIGKDEEYTVSVSSTVIVSNTGKATHGKIVPWLKTSSPVTLSTVLMRVELEYEF